MNIISLLPYSLATLPLFLLIARRCVASRLAHWHRVSISAQAEHGKTQTEVLWINPLAAQSRQLSLFDDGGAA